MPITIPQSLEVAGTVINNVRDLMPDPVYNAAGVAQPDQDGAEIRAQTLYRWLSAGIREMGRRIGWQVEDWWALPLALYQNTYALDARWRSIDWCFVNQYFCTYHDEPRTIYPAASAASGSQSYTFSTHRLTGQLDVYIYPGSGTTDVTTTLPLAITPGTDQITVASTAGFLSYGYVQIEQEIIKYQHVMPGQISAVQRGVAGTTAASHGAGVTVRHLGLWVKGKRAANPVSLSTDFLEVPYDALPLLEMYLLSRYREYEQSRGEAKSLMDEFKEGCDSIKRDPTSYQVPGYAQVQMYGGGHVGEYFNDGFGGVIIR